MPTIQNHDDSFLDFKADLFQDLIEEGYAGKQLLRELNIRQQQINHAMDLMIEEAQATAIPMSRQAFSRAINL